MNGWTPWWATTEIVDATAPASDRAAPTTTAASADASVNTARL